MLDWLNYHHLLYFTAVVDEGGLVPAAKRLRVTHPTVSAQIKKLEEHLELSLFERRGRRLELTEDGKMVYGYAGQIFGLGSALLEAVEGRRTGRAVLCRVGIDGVLSKLVVCRALAPLLDEFGDALRLRCIENERATLLRALEARNLDLVLSDGPAVTTFSRGIQSLPLADAPLGLFASPSVAARLEGEFPMCLDSAPFLLPMPTTRIRRDLERWLGSHRIRPRVVAEMEDSGLIKIFGQEGRGVFAMQMSVADEVRAQYDVVLLGVAEGIQSGLFAMVREEAHPAVDVIRRAAR